MKVLRESDLEWIDFEIPDSSAAVKIGRFRFDKQGMTALVRFPPGWDRPVAGHYEAEEQFLVLDGDLNVGGVDYSAGDFGQWRALQVRTVSSSKSGALTIAYFDGPARWKRTDDDEDPDPAQVRLPLKRVECRLSAAPAHADVELFSVPERSWVWVKAGDEFPDMPGPCLCWSHIMRSPNED